jgi:glycyl-tRNA synthetase beta chain
MCDLLYEIGTEELPSGYIRPALNQMKSLLGDLLNEYRLSVDDIVTTGTPRRLTICATGLPVSQPATTEEVVGPPAGVAYDNDGRPGKAAVGFARSQGVSTDDLVVKETDKGPYVCAVVEHPGSSTLEVLPDVLKEMTGNIRFPKSMRWPTCVSSTSAGVTSKQSELAFARPIRWLMALFGEDVIPLKIAGLSAGRYTYGHPFLSPGAIEVKSADYRKYAETLEDNYVVVGIEERADRIRDGVRQVLEHYDGGDVPEELLDEINGLVEFPCAIEGTFDEEFLEVPDCVLVAAMKGHQRYFPVYNDKGKLLNRFVIVSNRTRRQEETVRRGNERVLRARLADARFFWDEDRGEKLQERVPRLGEVVYLAGLGDNLQRTRRLEKLATRIGTDLGFDEARLKHLQRAAYLCKADLLTGLVGEFPTLQGEVGRELALADGEPVEVANAIAEHYLPVGTDDSLPESPAGMALALADKFDVIVGCYAMGISPSGSQDPYALRRNALGILEILEVRNVSVPLSDMAGWAGEEIRSQGTELGTDDIDVPTEKILSFFQDRLFHSAVDRGYPHDFIRAVLATGFGRRSPSDSINYNVPNFWKRLEALRAIADEECWADLVEVVDRTFRIGRELANEGVHVDRSLLKEDMEGVLFELLEEKRTSILSLFDSENYVEAASEYCTAFAEPVHDFFEEVFVNVDDEAVRRNRKSLCAVIYRLFADHFADLALIEGAGHPSV